MAEITHALAVDFDHTGEALTLNIQADGTARIVTVAAVSDARVLLADSAHDLLQLLQAALNAASPSLPGGVSFAVTMSSVGKVVITCTGTSFKLPDLASKPIGATLGFTSGVLVFAKSATAQNAPKYLALFISKTGSLWTPAWGARFGQTADGRSQGWRSDVLAWENTALTFGWIPLDPSTASSLGAPQTPAHPSAADLSTLGAHATPWSVSDFLVVSGGKTLAFAEGNFQTLRTSTSESFWLCSLDAQSLTRPRLARREGVWDAYLTLSLGLMRQSTPSDTRA